MKKLVAVLLAIMLLFSLTAHAETGPGDARTPAELTGSWKLVKFRAECRRDGSYVYALDISGSLHIKKAAGTHLTLREDGTLDTDVDAVGLAEGAPKVMFDLPYLSVQGDRYTVADGLISFLPDGDEWSFSCEGDSLTLTCTRASYVHHDDEHPNIAAGKADVTVTMGFERLSAEELEKLAAATPRPEIAPVQQHTRKPTEEPTPAPTPEPTEEPTPEPAPEPTPEPEPEYVWEPVEMDILANGPLTREENREIVTFGRWEQDEDREGKEPIEWLVLENDGEKALLISRLLLRDGEFNELIGPATWETSSMREWLNGDFIENAFTPAEQAHLIETAVTADENPEYGTPAGRDTRDRAWLMSADEAQRWFPTPEERIACPTAITACYGMGTYGPVGSMPWLLRTPGRTTERIAAVDQDGELAYDFEDTYIYGHGIRPMICVGLRGGEIPTAADQDFTYEDEYYSYLTVSDDSIYMEPLLFAAESRAAALLRGTGFEKADPKRLLVLRFDMMDGDYTEKEIDAVRGGLMLFNLQEGKLIKPSGIVTALMPGERNTVRAFDLIYEDDAPASRDSYWLLNDKSLYPLAKLSEEGLPLKTAYLSDITGIGEDVAEEILSSLNNDAYRKAYDAVMAGEVLRGGSKGDAARGVQQMLADFGKKITVDGKLTDKNMETLNAVQEAFGLEQTDSLDAEGYIRLLPRLLTYQNTDDAYWVLSDSFNYDEYDYMCGCAMMLHKKYAAARTYFENSEWADWEKRAAACVQRWPRTGVIYSNPAVQGDAAELAVQFNGASDTAMLVKIYTAKGVLARMMFIGGTGKATASLPAGTYIIKDGTGKNWYGEEDAFGSEGNYEIMTFSGGEQELQLKRNYRTTITVNVQENNPDAEGVGSDWESWEDF